MIVEAARAGKLEEIQNLIAKGSSINETCPRVGSTAILAASDRGHISIVNFLLKAKANVNLLNNQHLTALDKARDNAFGGPHTEIAGILIKAGGVTAGDLWMPKFQAFSETVAKASFAVAVYWSKILIHISPSVIIGSILGFAIAVVWRLIQHRKHTNAEGFLKISVNHSNSGFFAQVQFVLNQILYASALGLKPVVYISRDLLDGPNGYYDGGKGDNVWEYYFEAINGVTMEDAWMECCKNKKLKIYQASQAELWRIHHNNLSSIFTYPYGCYSPERGLWNNEEQWWVRMRRRAACCIQQHIVVKKDITNIVDHFARVHFTEFMVGCHIRGTDKHDVGAGPILSAIIPPEAYFPYIEEQIQQHPECKIFLATDQMQFRDSLNARYGARMIYYTETQSLSSDGVNAFQQGQRSGRNNYDKGKSVLIDCLLLSRCDLLVKCTSAVGEFVSYFNPSLPVKDLNLVGYQQHTSSKWKPIRQLVLASLSMHQLVVEGLRLGISPVFCFSTLQSNVKLK